MRTIKLNISELISNFSVLFAVMFFSLVLFGFNPELTENSMVYRNMVIPHIAVNITIMLAVISLIAIVLILLCKQVRFDNVMAILLFRIPIYFIPLFYLRGNWKIGVAYSMIQCFFAYFIGSQYRDNFNKIVKLLIVFSIAISIEVFAVIIINKISIFSLDLKWFMVLPMGKSNYISCFLLPIYCLVDNYWSNQKRVLKYAYTAIIFVAILGTGSKLALILFLAYQGIKSIRMFKTSKNAVVIYVVAVALIIFTVNKFQTGVISIVMKFTQNNIFENRLRVYSETFNLISENFFFGRSAYTYQVFDATKTHNLFLESLMQTGIIGTILFVYVLYIAFKKILRIQDMQVKKAVISFFAIYLIQGLAEPNMFGATSDSFFWLIIGFGCAFSQWLERTQNKIQLENKRYVA